MKPLIQSLVTDPDLISVIQGLKGGMREQLVAGLSGSARQAAIAGMYRELGRPILVVTHNMFRRRRSPTTCRNACRRTKCCSIPPTN